MQNIGKKHDSCVRVLEFLKLLIQKDVDIRDLNNYKDGSFWKNIEATETFLKYIATLDVSGFEVKKCEKKYSLCSFLKKLQLDDREINLLSEMYSVFDKSCVETQRKSLDGLITLISKSLDEPLKSKFLNQIDNVRKLKTDDLSEESLKYQEYVDIGQKIKIKYKGEEITAEPKSVEIEKGKIYFVVYNSYIAENMRILTDDIEKIELLPIKSSTLNMMRTVVFEVYDRLAVNYRLRENERVQTCSDSRKVIISYGEDRRDLIRRLLKYGENCKIISPKPFQDEYLKELSLIEEKFQGVH